MSTEKTRAEMIFFAALERSDLKERREFLEQECGDDAPLFVQVQRLLDAHGKVDHFMEGEAVDVVATRQAAINESPGNVIGNCKLLQKIGEGGFGVVFLAQQQQPIRRKVALKIVKPGMDSKEVVARFE